MDRMVLIVDVEQVGGRYEYSLLYGTTASDFNFV